MREFLNIVKKFGQDEEGASLVEYCVLLGVLVAGTITAMTAMGTNAAGMFTYASNLLTAPVAP
jgi:Flp pilus assembly pilin Flp